MGLFDVLKNGFREGRDAAVAERKAEVIAERERCRVHGRRYPGCPLDLIETGRLTPPPPPAAGKRVRPPAG